MYIYQSQKIPYYLIVDVDKNEIEIYHLDMDGRYQLADFSPDEPYAFTFDAGCSADVVFNNIWE